MKFASGKLYKVVYPQWLVELACTLESGKIKVVKDGTIVLYIEKTYSSKGDLVNWFLDSDGIKIKFQTSKSDPIIDQFFEEIEIL
jgi:hypothetical protein